MSERTGKVSLGWWVVDEIVLTPRPPSLGKRCSRLSRIEVNGIFFPSGEITASWRDKQGLSRIADLLTREVRQLA